MVVLRGVPKEISFEEVKEGLRAQKIPVQAVHRITNKLHKPLGLVLVAGTTEAKDKGKRAAFFKIKSCLGNHGTAQCTSNKETDRLLACVVYKEKGHMANYLGCPRVPKKALPPVKAALRQAPMRAVSHIKLHPCSGGITQRPAHIQTKSVVQRRRLKPINVNNINYQ
ncbi:hypothetical protein EVAR_64770_1 [Eumeta japonica]|uniref:Uncharacterized protein n=1 Tax=Eumeta variegata TaxID=151549 RepID=A0A4C1ZDK8_EUMVA|nr:hypothetical protein EVAR_64770_1 [Eumeta japonica]